MLWLSFTAASRYERCGELQRQWREKLVTRQKDERPFFLGRVLHAAFESWLLGSGSSLPHLFAAQWPGIEADSVIFWRGVNDRHEMWSRGIALAERLQIDVERLHLRQYQLLPEQRLRAEILEGLGMYAQPDVIAYHPSEPLAYVVELKSGKSFDPAQVAWYAAVCALRRYAYGQPPIRLAGLTLRPAMDNERVQRRELSPGDIQSQIDRARDVGSAMLEGHWPIKEQSYCGVCEGQILCPAYQKYRHGTGRVGLG